jgi:hypothetical protein
VVKTMMSEGYVLDDIMYQNEEFTADGELYEEAISIMIRNTDAAYSTREYNMLCKAYFSAGVANKLVKEYKKHNTQNI